MGASDNEDVLSRRDRGMMMFSSPTKARLPPCDEASCSYGSPERVAAHGRWGDSPIKGAFPWTLRV